MNKLILLFLFLCVSNFSYSQYFSGEELTYYKKYKVTREGTVVKVWSKMENSTRMKSTNLWLFASGEVKDLKYKSKKELFTNMTGRWKWYNEKGVVIFTKDF